MRNQRLRSVYVAILAAFAVSVVVHNVYLFGYRAGCLDAAPPIIMPVSKDKYLVFLGSEDIPLGLIPPEGSGVFLKKKKEMSIYFPHYKAFAISRRPQ